MELNLNIDADLERFFADTPFFLHGAVQDSHVLRHTLRNESERFKEIRSQLSISLVALAHPNHAQHIKRLLVSCVAQSWPFWTLCLVGISTDSLPVWARHDPRIQTKSEIDLSEAIKTAKSDFVGLIETNSVLHPQILGIFARTILESPSTNLIYCNEAIVDQNSQLQPLRAKSRFDRATLLRCNYLGRLTLLKRELVCSLVDDWCNDEHLLLMTLSEAGVFHPIHVPVFGYVKTQALASNDPEKAQDKQPIRSFLERQFPNQSSTSVRPSKTSGKDTFCFHFQPKKHRKLGIIVPYRDGFEVTKRCLEAIELQKTTLQVRVVLVDNNSCPDTQGRVDQWLNLQHRYEYSKIDYNGAFNFAKINNQAVSTLASSVDFLLLLNNDVELLSENALESMAGELEAHNELAFVGIKLWYPEKTALQHGGIRITSMTEGLGFHRAEHILEEDEFVHEDHIVAAVTFASAMCRSQIWAELGGLEEQLFPNGYGDIDLCFRAFAAGYHNFYLGSIEGIHHESRTRKANSEECEIVLINERHAAAFAHWSTRSSGGKPTNLELTSWSQKPLRYRIADLANNILKTLTGRWHREFKYFLSRKFDTPKHD